MTKTVCERVLKEGVSKMVCDKAGCERGCVKDSVRKMLCDKDGV